MTDSRDGCPDCGDIDECGCTPTRQQIAEYLDYAIRQWRKSTEPHAQFYVDAFQSARVSLLGELLPLDGTPDARETDR